MLFNISPKDSEMKITCDLNEHHFTDKIRALFYSEKGSKGVRVFFKLLIGDNSILSKLIHKSETVIFILENSVFKWPKLNQTFCHYPDHLGNPSLLVLVTEAAPLPQNHPPTYFFFNLKRMWKTSIIMHTQLHVSCKLPVSHEVQFYSWSSLCTEPTSKHISR